MEAVFAELFEIACELHIAIASTSRPNLFPTCHFGFKVCVRVQLALHFSWLGRPSALCGRDSENDVLFNPSSEARFRPNSPRQWGRQRRPTKGWLLLWGT